MADQEARADDAPSRYQWLDAEGGLTPSAVTEWAARGFHPLLAGCLSRRGCLTPEAAGAFLDPKLANLSDPFRLPGMTPAVTRVLQALRNGESICVFGDYDADGVTSTALLTQVLQRLGASVSTYLPSRFEAGYGFTREAYEDCRSRYDPRLIITVDCGTSSNQTCAQAARDGIDVIVTDHHEAGDTVADAIALINPKVNGPDDLRILAGVGVAFKLCHALIKQGLGEGWAPARTVDLRDLLPLAAIGTVADVVPLLGENRTLVRHGLERLSDSAHPGVRALMRSARVHAPVSAYDIAFGLAPRINAAGRVEHPRAALEVLMASSPMEAQAGAQVLESYNQRRKKIEDGIRREAEDDADRARLAGMEWGIVVGRTGWHIGTLGIIAARLAGSRHCPAVVIGFDEHGEGHGSCRGHESCDLVEILNECREHLTQFGGHKMAAGVQLSRDAFHAFQQAFNDACRRRLESRDRRPSLSIEAWVTPDDIVESLAAELEKLRPFGCGNESPLFGWRNAQVVESRPIGKGMHRRVVLTDGTRVIPAVAFGTGNRTVPSRGDFVFHVEMNRYAGRSELQLRIRDWCSGLPDTKM